MARKSQPKPDVGIIELTKIVNRVAATIRQWEKVLPEHLLPGRDERDYRIWTHEQVYGENGILAWMDDNDMRPGKLVADPSTEAQHIQNLRKPKKLNGDQLRGVQMMIDNGRDREYIIRKLFPRTDYSTEKALESALVAYYKHQGKPFPPKKRRPYPTRAMRMERARLTGTPLYDMSNRRAKAKEEKKRRKKQAKQAPKQQGQSAGTKIKIRSRRRRSR